MPVELFGSRLRTCGHWYVIFKAIFEFEIVEFDYFDNFAKIKFTICEMYRGER